MAVLCRLVGPDQYVVSIWNLMDDPQVAGYWLDLFGSFSERFDKLLLADGLAGDGFERRWPIFQREYDAGMADLRRRAEATGRLYTIELCRYRQAMLDKHGFYDPYAGVKARENATAAGLYPEVVARIDAAPPDERWPLLLRGLLAGNMFDLGSPETIAMYQRGEVDFGTFLGQVPDRPWFIDQADGLLDRLAAGGWRQVLFFADNAGADIVLGVMPVVREMARAGTKVVLAVNTGPALNDITLAELEPLLHRLAAVDSVLGEQLSAGRIRAVGSGNNMPLIDLGRVTEACNAAAAESDLVVLQGMGRGVESNWHEQFDCDVWRVAMLKDHAVVGWLGAKIFDAVCRFDAYRR